MPYINLNATTKITAEQEKKLLPALREAVSDAHIPHNGGDWLMCCLHGECKMSFEQAPNQDLAYVEVKTLGSEQTEGYSVLTKRLSAVIKDILDIPPECVYITYAATKYWGWNGNNL